MELSQKAIHEFKEIWESEYKEKISEEDAVKLAQMILQLFKVIYKPISINE